MNRFALLAVVVLVLPAACAQSQSLTASSDSLELASQLSLLREASVREELQVSAEQIEQLQQLRVSGTPGFPRGEGADLAARQAEQEKNLAQAKQKLAAVLKPEQAARLQQIFRQQRRANGLATMLSLTDVRSELKLSDEQSGRIVAINQTLTSQRRALFSDRTTYTSKSQELIATADREIEGLLNAEQNAKLKELLGPPFTGQIRQPFFSGGAPVGGSGSGGTLRAFPFSLGTVASPSLTLLRGEPVQQELKLTAEQKQKVAALPTATRGTNPVTLIEFLTPPQRDRLDQLTLQYALQRFGPLAWLRYKSAVEALALSEEQRQKITEIGREDVAAIAALGRTSTPDKVAAIDRETSDKLNGVLNEEQVAKRKQLVGELFAGQLQAGSPSRDARERSSRPFEVGNSTRSPWLYLTYPDVQKDLKLTDEQRQKLNLGQPLRTLRAEDVQAVLTAEQVARLWQVQLQSVKQRSGPASIFRYRDVAEAVAVTEQQKKSLAAVAEGGLGEGNGRSAEQQVAEILTDGQAAKVKELLGPAFEGQAGAPSTQGAADRFRSSPAEIQIASTSQSPGGWLRYPGVREDVKLSEEQTQKANAILQRERTIAPDALAELLSAEQLARLREVQRQLALRQNGAAYLFRYREVAEPLALSDEQKQKITQLARGNNSFRTSTDAAQQFRSQLNEILTAEQRTEFEKLLGRPFEGDLNLGGRQPAARPGQRQRPSP